MSHLFPYDQLPGSTVPDLSDQIERTTELIGKGGYGSVYKARWLGAAANTALTIVAIKIIDLVPLRDEAQRTKRFKQITRELSLWCSIQHDNILPLLGIALINGDTNVPAFVCPWMENGNAKEFCSRNPCFPRMLILYGIINGLHYLHTFQPEIVHGDIKAVNVLINNRFEACLCDFGLSRFLIDNTLWKTTATHAVGTVRWMAPELLNGDASTPTKKSDIYAYAMTCYEILSGDVPFKSVSNDMAIPLKVTKGQRPDRIKPFHSDFMWDIITQCWKQEPEDRLPTEMVLGLLRPKVDWKEVEEALAKFGEKDVVLAKVEKEMALLKGQMAKAEVDLKTLKEENEKATHQRKPCTETEKSLVIGIDIGTTLSGVSYALLEPGKVPRIQPVTRFPGQRQEKGDPKVPSVVCYDQDGRVIAVGPKTDPEVNPILSEIDVVRWAEWFKLRLRPPHLVSETRAQLEKILSRQEPTEEIDDYVGASDEDEYENDRDSEVVKPQPPNKKKIPHLVTDDFKTAVQVFADFLRYLFKSAKEYITETERNIDPTFTWSSIERNTYFVLTHPNVWEGKQQSQMLDAAIAAGIVDRSTAANRITFLTEGEASLHLYLEKIPRLHLEAGGFLVVDCGGVTIDLSAFSQIEKGGYKEIVSPDCLLQGSIFVTSRARDYFRERFKGSQFGSNDDVEAMIRAFDKPEGAKCMFGDPNIHYLVKFAGMRDTDRKYGISRGTFKLDGTQIAEFFQPAVQDIICGIEKQCRNAKEGVSVKLVLLTGGFARSPYLYTTLRNHFKNTDIVVHRPDIEYLNNVVADGAVFYFVDRYASAWITNDFYGIEVNRKFNPADPDHVRRESTKFKNANGDFQIPGGFLTILEKGTTVTEETQFRWSSQMYFTPEELSQWSDYSMTIKCYTGQAASSPQWLDFEPGIYSSPDKRGTLTTDEITKDSFHDACIIRANMTNVKNNITPQNNGNKQIYQFDFEVVMFFGFAELKAYIAWKENGEEKRSDAFIVYD